MYGGKGASGVACELPACCAARTNKRGGIVVICMHSVDESTQTLPAQAVCDEGRAHPSCDVTPPSVAENARDYDIRGEVVTRTANRTGRDPGEADGTGSIRMSVSTQRGLH